MPDQRKAGCNSGILEAWSSAPTSVSTASLAGRVFPFPLDVFLLTLQGFPQTDSHQNCYFVHGDNQVRSRTRGVRGSFSHKN